MTSRRLPFLLVLLSAPLGARQLEWRAAIGAAPTPLSTLTSVEAVGGTATAAFACGFFEGSFGMGPGSPFTNPSGTDGVVLRFEETPGWDVAWKTQATSSGKIELRDLSISPGGAIYVCGTFEDDVQLGAAGNFNDPGGPHGFVARLDPANGDWTFAYRTPGILPVSLVAGPSGNVLLTGPGTLAAAYSATGTQLWSAPVPTDVDEWGHIAVDPTSSNAAYVLTRRDAQTTEEIFLRRIDLSSSGSIVWTRTMGSDGPDFLGGLDVAPDGHPRVLFTSDHPVPRYDGTPVPGAPLGASIHSLVARVRPDGSPVWITPVGNAVSPAAVGAVDLDCDAFGNAWIPATFDGTVNFEGIPRLGDQDAALVAIDGAGLLYDFHRTSGASAEKPLAVAAPTPNLAIIVGEYTGADTTFVRDTPPALQLPPTATPLAFFAPVDPVPGQILYVLRPTGPLTIPQLTGIIHQNGGQVYATAESPLTGLAVSAWLTTTQLDDLNGNPDIFIEPESFLATNGSGADAGWALGRLNDPSAAAISPYSYTAPETRGEVVVHLIDTAVDGLGGWFSANANLGFESTTLIRGAGDPTESSAFEHGTQMLSLIAGPECGAATATPIRLRSYDIYPSGATTTSALLADAILEAIAVHLAEHPCTPGVICIASSSTTTASSTSLLVALSLATSNGLPVVLSAGNSAANAALYVPQQYAGAGVLCVGASDPANTRAAVSNFGAPVDLYAPGENVWVVDFPTPAPGSPDTFTGTSASAALVTAIAAAHLSTNPWQSPASLEAAVLADAHPAAIDLAQLAAAGPAFTGSFADWAAWHDLGAADFTTDSDGDLILDGLEFALGLDPCGPDHPALTPFSFDGTDSEFSFTVNAVLYDAADPGKLLDGTTWKVKSSTDLDTWSDAPGTFTFGDPEDGRIPVTLTDTPTDPACFLRLEITPAP